MATFRVHYQHETEDGGVFDDFIQVIAGDEERARYIAALKCDLVKTDHFKITKAYRVKTN